MAGTPRAALVLLAALLFSGPAFALVSQVNVNPGAVSIPSDRPGSLSLAWQVTSIPDAAGSGGGGSQIVSSFGQFRTEDGTVIGTRNQVLQGLAQGTPGQAGTAVMSESLTVPLAVLDQAVGLGATRIVYERQFEVSGVPQRTGNNIAGVTLSLTAALAVDVNPPAASVATGQASSLTFAWRVSGAAGAGEVASPQGQFMAAGRVLGSVSRRLSAPVNAAGDAVLTETVQVPLEVVLRAERLGATRIGFRRSFTAGSAAPASADAVLDLVGPLGGPFNISGLTLRFGDGSGETVAAVGGRLFAFADIVHTGSGRLEAEWEVAEPPSTRGAPIFRVVERVTRQLIGAGTRMRIRSPDLPNRNEGAYLVRLRVLDPAPGFDPPILRYFVNEAVAVFPEPAPLGASAPAPGAVWMPGTRFAWEPATGAAAYRLEFHEGPAPEAGQSEAALPDRPVSGVALGGADTQAALSRLAESRLVPGTVYWWRVLAYDAEGVLIGRSEPRRIVVPEDGERP